MHAGRSIKLGASPDESCTITVADCLTRLIERKREITYAVISSVSDTPGLTWTREEILSLLEPTR
jgi:Asp/Glu/hydantoin racemase